MLALGGPIQVWAAEVASESCCVKLHGERVLDENFVQKSLSNK